MFSSPPPPAHLERRLGPLDAAAIIVSNVIGGGILFTPPQVAAMVPSPGPFLLTWVAGGALAFTGAIAYAELGALRPKAGGEYVWHRWEASRKTVCDRLQSRLKEYAGDHGMEVTARGIAVDYKRLVRDSAARLRPIAAEFRRKYGPSKKALLEAVHSFFQSIPYRQTPPVESGRYTAGVSLPLRVLADDQADCDSKAVLFAALWLNLCNHRTTLIRIPEHMLVGLAVPFAEGATIDIGSTRYLLLELSCPQVTAPGTISQRSADALASQRPPSGSWLPSPK